MNVCSSYAKYQIVLKSMIFFFIALLPQTPSVYKCGHCHPHIRSWKRGQTPVYSLTYSAGRGIELPLAGGEVP